MTRIRTATKPATAAASHPDLAAHDTLGLATQAELDAAATAARARANHTGTQLAVTVSDLGTAATRNVGIAAGTVAAGDDSRFTAAAQNTQTASYTLALADAGTLVEINAAAANTFTVPPASAVNFPIGTQISGRQYGAGLTSVTAGAGVTIRSRGAALKSAGQYAEWLLTKRAADEWVLTGDVTA